MKLYVIRHAQAGQSLRGEAPVKDDKPGSREARAEAQADEKRPLSERGRKRTEDAAKGLRALGVGFDVILTSALTRAGETAEIVAAAYGNDPAPQVLPALSPGVPPRQLLSAIAPFAQNEKVLIVGHEPQLSGFVALMLTSDAGVHIKIKKGACVALESKACQPGGAQLSWMLTQRHLRKLRHA
jgi:phosphohistidine phosphatase